MIEHGIGIALGIVIFAIMCLIICVRNYQSKQADGIKNRRVNEMRKMQNQIENKTKSGEPKAFPNTL